MIDRLLPRWKSLDGKNVCFIIAGHNGKAGLQRTANDLHMRAERYTSDDAGVSSKEAAFLQK